MFAEPGRVGAYRRKGKRVELRLLCVVCTLSIGLALRPGAALAAPAISGGAEMDYNSRYVWRGIPSSDRAVRQPSLWLDRSKLSLGLWANGEMGNGLVNEADLTLSYAGSRRSLSMEPSLQFYFYPDQEDAPTTGELSLKLSHPVGSATLFTQQYLDLVEYRGAYFGELGFSKEWSCGPKASAEGEVRLGWGSSRFNASYLSTRKGAANYVAMDLGMKLALSRSSYLRPHIGASTILDRDLRRQTSRPSSVMVGAAMGAEF
jgi:hypothetical protein